MEGQAIARRWPPGPTRDLSVPPRSASINPVVLSGAMDVFLPFKALPPTVVVGNGFRCLPAWYRVAPGLYGERFPRGLGRVAWRQRWQRLATRPGGRSLDEKAPHFLFIRCSLLRSNISVLQAKCPKTYPAHFGIPA